MKTKRKMNIYIILLIVLSYFIVYMLGCWNTRHSAELVKYNDDGYTIYYHNTNNTEFYY